MNYNKPDTKLDECIFIAEKIIPVDFCDAVVQEIEARPWQPHTWYSNAQDSYYSEETKELDVQNSTPKLQRVLGSYVIEAGRQYNQNYQFTWALFLCV